MGRDTIKGGQRQEEDMKEKRARERDGCVCLIVNKRLLSLSLFNFLISDTVAASCCDAGLSFPCEEWLV